MNTWERNPQNPADEHDWVVWFADYRLFKDVAFEVHQEWGIEVAPTP